MSTIYEKHSFSSREDYLIHLGEDLGIDMDVVYIVSDLLGPDEDFDGLVTMLEDYDQMGEL